MNGLESPPIKNFEAYIFDMDGTIYLGDEVLDGAVDLFSALRAHNMAVRFLSNNPTKDPLMYVEKLDRMGIEAHPHEVINTVVTTVNWLVRNHPDAVVFPIAEPALINALDRAGIARSDDPAKIDIVIASYDRTFDYRKLQIAFDALWFHRRAFMITTNPDRYCPFPGGRGEPDAASIVGAIRSATGVGARFNMGKPDQIMIDETLSSIMIEPAHCLMVGDRLGTDVSMGRRAGMQCALVLTGDTGLEEAQAARPPYAPDMVIESLRDLL